MRKAALAFCALALALPAAAHAFTEPKPSRNEPRVLTAPYRKGEVYALHLVVGRAMTVTVPGYIWVDDVASSDTVHVEKPTIYGSTVVFKATGPAEPRPMFVIGHDKEGMQRIVPFEVDVASMPPPLAPENGAPKERLAQLAHIPAGDTQAFALNLVDEAAEAAARNAAWVAIQKRREQDRTAAMLRDPPRPAGNTDYAASGDRAVVGR